MKSIKADQVLPGEVLSLVQRYIQGELLYIPKPKDTHKKWGDNTRGKELTASRNQQIQAAYRAGVSIERLSDEYHLSLDSIRKIAYRRE